MNSNERIIKINVRKIEKDGKIKYFLCGVNADQYSHPKKHKIDRKRSSFVIKFINLFRNKYEKILLNTLIEKDDFNYQVEDDGRLYIISDGDKMYPSKDATKFLDENGFLWLLSEDGEKFVCHEACDELMTSLFPYKFISYKKEKDYYNKLQELKNVLQNSSNVVNINDYRKKGR